MTDVIALTCTAISLLAACAAVTSSVRLRRRIEEREVLWICRCPLCGKVTRPQGARVMYCSGNQLGPNPQPRGKHDSEPMEKLTVQVVGVAPPQVTIDGGTL